MPGLHPGVECSIHSMPTNSVQLTSKKTSRMSWVQVPHRPPTNMPQSSKELRDKWGIDGQKALDYLLTMNWECGPDFILRSPHNRTKFEEDELSAVKYLFEEWDFGVEWA